MANELLTRCGYRCDLCLAYKENIKKEDRRQVLSDGWFKCFGFRIPAEEIFCDGCLTSGPARLIHSACPVRPCLLSKGLENCAQCSEYPCDKFRQRQVLFEDVARGKELTATDRELFIRPHENKVRLDAIRRGTAD